MRDPRGCDVARKAMWQSHASPRERLRGVEVAQTCGRAMQVHADAWVTPCGERERVTGLASEGPTGWWALVSILGR